MKKIDVSKDVRKEAGKKVSVQGWCMILLAVIIVIIISDAITRAVNRNNNIENTNQVVVSENGSNEDNSMVIGSEVTETTEQVQETLDTSIYNIVSKTSNDVSKGALTVVSEKHPTSFPDISDKLSDFYYAMGSGYKMATFDIKISEDAIEPFNNMMKDFYTQSGINYVTIVDGYTDKDTDDTNGTSDNCSGYALDFKLVTDSQILDYDGTGDYSWIESNCYKYGFIIRYPEADSETTGVAYTPSHFRYVGIPHSNIMQDKSLCLEDYIDFVKQYSFYDEHLFVTLGDIDYEIYYVKSEGETTDVPVPKDRYYSISGDNIAGFIVTTLK